MTNTTTLSLTRRWKNKTSLPSPLDLTHQGLLPVSHTKKRRSTPLATDQKPHRYMTRLQVQKLMSKNTTILYFQSAPSIRHFRTLYDFTPLSQFTNTSLKAVHFPNPGISIAFSDGDYNATSILPQTFQAGSSSTSSITPASDSQEITHVIRLSHLTARAPRRDFQRKYPLNVRHEYRNGLAWANYDGSARLATLDLVIPRKPPSSSNTTRLTEGQMKMAKDFLELVLLTPSAGPHPQARGMPDDVNLRVPDPFNILITAPLSVSRLPRVRAGGHLAPQDTSLSLGSRDILALIGDQIDSDRSNVVKTRDALLYLEEMMHLSNNNS